MSTSPQDYEYVMVEGGACINRYTGRAQNLVIPELVDGMPVVGIAPYAFEGNTELRDVICPPHVVEMGSRAFANCPALERIVFPINLARYENSWVAGCTRLEKSLCREPSSTSTSPPPPRQA